MLSGRGAGRALAWLAVAAVLAGPAWIAVTQVARSARETRSAEQLAAGRGRWVEAGDARVYRQDWGREGAPTLLLTHGTGAWSGTWFELPERLAQAGWHVVAIDLPPFGLSQVTTDPPDYSRAAQARRIAAVLRELSQPVVLVGHSFGAGPALEAAMQAGGGVRQLVLIDPALGLGADGSAAQCVPPGAALQALRWQPLRSALVAATATWPPLTGRLLASFVHRTEVITPTLLPAYRQPFERSGFSAGLGDWALQFAASACEPARSLQPSALTGWAAHGPALSLLWGAEDTVTPLAQAQALKTWMPSAELVVLPGVGHIPHIEDPPALAAALLRQVERSRR